MPLGLGLCQFVVSGFTPAQLPAITLWLDANKGTNTTTNGAAITSWADQSGHGNNATQGNASWQPTYSAAGLNGHPGINGNGATQWLQTATLTLNTTAQCTVFMVCTGSLSTTAIALEYGPSVGTTAGTWGIVPGDHAATFLEFFTNSDGTHFSAGDFAPGAPFTGSVCQINAVFDLTIPSGMQMTARFNRAAQTLTQQNSGTSASAFTNQPLNIGARSTGPALPWTGLFGEIIVCATKLSAGLIQQTETYLQSKWGLP